MNTDIELKIDTIFSKWQRGFCPGGQVAVRKNSEIIYYKNFGYANLEHQIPVKDETIFHVASVSKQITVMCVLLLQEDGLLNIDHDVREYVSDYIKFDEPVTVRQMMNNVSGIRDQWELLGLSGVRIVDTITQRDALSIIGKQRKLNFEPQSEFLYSNSNFTLLAEIVERLSGKTLNEFATDRIFYPLGMNSTFFKDNYWKAIHNKASSYFDDGASNYYYSVLNYGTYGATSLNTTATDFLKWMDNYRNPLICSEDTLSLMSHNPTLTDGKESSYAGGLFVGEHKGHKYIEHGGADAAYRSAMLRFIDDDIDIVVLANTQNMLMKDAAFAVADVVLGYEDTFEKTERPTQYSENVDLDKVGGYYFSSEAFMAFDISVREGELHMKNPYGFAPLIHVSGNHYKIEQFNLDLFLGESSVVKTKEKLYPLKKLHHFHTNKSTKYTGKYRSSELDTVYHVIEKDGSLHLSHFRNEEHVLYQLDENSFVTNAPFTILVEFLTEGDQVSGFVFNGGRVKNVKLMKEEE